jgi:hypothetical protein
MKVCCHAPDNSFKPIPHCGISCVLYATLARVRRPVAGRHNSASDPAHNNAAFTTTC